MESQINGLVLILIVVLLSVIGMGSLLIDMLLIKPKPQRIVKPIIKPSYQTYKPDPSTLFTEDTSPSEVSDPLGIDLSVNFSDNTEDNPLLL